MAAGGAGVDYEAYHRGGRTAAFADVYERVRVRTVEEVLRRARVGLPDGGALVDLGAGEGRYLPLWAALFPGAHVTAVEVSELASERSALRHPLVRHLVADAQAVPLGDASFDALVSIEVIE